MTRSFLLFLLVAGWIRSAQAQRIEEEVFTGDQQVGLCNTFLRGRFTDLKNKFEEYGTTIEEGYDQVICESRYDLLKHRMLIYDGRSDLAAFILYYKRDLNRPDELVRIFNKVIQGPQLPHGTLLDFVQYYYDVNPTGTSEGQIEYARMITLLKAHGANYEREL